MSWRRAPLIILALVLMLVAAACGGDGGAAAPEETTEPAEMTETETAEPEATGEPTQIGLVYDIGGRGDLSFNDSAAEGLDRANEDFNLAAQELEPDEGGENREELLRLLSEQGSELIFGVGFLFSDAIAAASADFPDTNYGLIDGFIPDLTEDSNVVALAFAEEQGSFLVGAAAAMKSETGHVGFIGGVDIELIHKFQAGFEAGATHVNPDIRIDVQYITQPPDFAGFNDPARGKEIALGMYSAGADIVYHAAGGSGSGLFEAAQEVSESGDSKVWAIGVDSDQALTAPEDVREYILTSMIKRVDVAVYETIASYIDEGAFTGGYRTFGLEDEGIAYSTTGGHVDDIADQLEELKQQIIDGEIEVPTAP